MGNLDLLAIASVLVKERLCYNSTVKKYCITLLENATFFARAWEMSILRVVYRYSLLLTLVELGTGFSYSQHSNQVSRYYRLAFFLFY